MRLVLVAVLALAAAAPAQAATRTYSVIDFDRIRVDGPYKVTLRVGPPVSAAASGDQRAIDRLKIAVEGRTLIVRTDSSGWGGWVGESPGKVSVTVTAPALTSAIVSGSGALDIDHAKAMKFDLAVSGSGSAAIGALTADRLALALVGSGQVTVAGRAAQTQASLQGSGGIDAGKLAVDDLTVSATGSGNGRPSPRGGRPR